MSQQSAMRRLEREEKEFAAKMDNINFKRNMTGQALTFALQYSRNEDDVATILEKAEKYRTFLCEGNDIVLPEETRISLV